MLILNNLAPIFAVITLGVLLRRFNWVNEEFTRTTDKLIYYIFFPGLLFWKIGKPAAGPAIETGLIAGVFITVFLVFLISLILPGLLKFNKFQVGSFSQGCYRFSSYIGLALTFSALGEAGGRCFGVLIGFIIPFINVLAVSSVTWYSGEVSSNESKLRLVGKSILSNPLILACFAGIFYSRLCIPFPVFVDNTLALMSSVTLPLALVSIGATLPLTGNRKYLAKGFLAAVVKLIVMPVIGYFCLSQLNVSHLALQVAIIYFALPTSPQNYVLSSQLNSDVDLATSSILISTILSIISLSVVLMIFV